MGDDRPHNRVLLTSLSLLLASASLSACGDNAGEDSAELQAILRDGDLTEVMRSMLTETPDSKPGTGTGTGTGGGSGTMMGAGGTTGAAGAGFPSTGVAGSSGAAGRGPSTGIAGSFGGGPGGKAGTGGGGQTP